MQILVWWLIIEALGLVALPIALRLFRFLPDRGYAFAKPLGLLLTSYIVWLLVSFGILRNEAVTILFVAALIGAYSWLLFQRDGVDLRSFLRRERGVILAAEILFMAAFLLWTFFRAYNPALDATERPMDLAFLNAIVRSETFPPNDPWLSGFALSYYYFGYLMMATMTKLSGLPGAVAFNLSIALLFALTATGAFSLVYNLVRRAQQAQRDTAESDRGVTPVLFGVLGALFTVVIGNLHGFFDALRARGLGSAALWEWLDLKKIANAPVTGRWFPTDPPDPWWWWRASRVIHDRDLLGRDSEVIDEFPFFSFLLGDMHPHVLGLPFVLLAMGLALNVLLGFTARTAAADDEAELDSAGEAQPSWIERLFARAISLFRAHAFDLLLWALCLGALSFLNTWDFPIYLVIFVAALFLRHYLAHGEEDWTEPLLLAAWVAVPGVLLYLPFYIGFRSQAGGILPVLYNVTRLPQYLIMFGLFIFCLLSWIVVQWRDLLALRDRDGERWLPPRQALGQGVKVAAGILALPLAALALSVLLVVGTSRGRAFLQDLLATPEAQAAVGGQSIGALLQRFALMRLTNPWLVLLLVGMIAALVTAIWHRARAIREGVIVADESATDAESNPRQVLRGVSESALFVALIATTGLLLTLATEFVYLRDLFGTRMNTIFKFWYQAWVQMAIASAFGVWYLLRGRKQWGMYIWLVFFLLLLGASMIYPLAASYSKAQQFRVQPTLDGIAYLRDRRPGDHAAIRWLQENVVDAPYILEAPGGSYTEYARVSAATGLPTVLGWDFHEQQWRGTYEEPGKRLPDIEQIYKSLDRNLVLGLLNKYNIEYVYVGDLERQKYNLQPAMVDKFGRIMTLVYDQGGVRIYRRR